VSAFTLSSAELRARSGRKWHEYPADVLPAWVAEMDFEVAEPIRAVLRGLTDEAAYGYEPSSEYAGLAETFATYMQQRFGWQPAAEQVLPIADLVQALYTTVAAFSERGQGVVLQTPIYPPFHVAVRDTHRRIVEHRLIDDGSRYVMDTRSLADVFNADAPVFLLCNPHNPTGRVFERAELEAIAEVAVDRQLTVVADEVHADLIYPGRQHIPFASLGPEVAERTVTLTSATKAYNIPGLRCGLMHFGSQALRERFRDLFPDRMLGTVNRFGIDATVVAWRECGQWLDDVMSVLGENRQRLAAAELPGVRCYAPEATYLAWLDCRALNLSESPQRWFLDNAGVAMNEGADFLGPGFARLNFGTSPEILNEILARIASAVQTKRF
jgi:cysteine-S-conjugate beta-lyase